MFDGYRFHVDRNIVPTLGPIPLKKLTPPDVQALTNAKSTAGLSPRTVRYIRAVLRTALNQAVVWALVDRNAAQHISMPRVKKPQLAVLAPKDAKKLMLAAKKARLGPLFTVAMAVGLQIGEACAVRWVDVDLARGTLRVVQAVQWHKGKVSFVEPKSESSRRTVKLPDFAVRALTRHRTDQKREQLAFGKRWVDSGLVFTTTTGTALDYANVRRDFKDLLKNAKVRDDLRLHDLRHTCATLLLIQGTLPRWSRRHSATARSASPSTPTRTSESTSSTGS